MPRLRSLFLCTVAAVAVIHAAYGEGLTVPKLTRYLTDSTGTLMPSEWLSLENQLSQFDQATSTQIVVLMIPSLEGESLEDYSLRVAEGNGIGQKEKRNGVLLLIAKNDRRMRIEVGYGLEGVLPDILSGQIIRKEIGPKFRTGDYYGGIKAGIEAIMLATKNEYKADKRSNRDSSIGWLPLLILFFMLFVFMRSFSRRRSLVGGVPPIFYPGWGSSTRSGSGWGGGGFGGGGFSGGGGSFGGGGASGSW